MMDSVAVNDFAKNYLYLLVTIFIFNVVLGLVYVFTKMPSLWAPLFVASGLEVIVFIMSIAIIIMVFLKNLKRINLVMPFVYLASSFAMNIVAPLGPDTRNMDIKAAFLSAFDISVPFNLIMFIINISFYVFSIVFSMYLLRNDDAFIEGNQENGDT